MGRRAKPWFWKARNAWYVNVHGKRIRLVDGKASDEREAYRRFLKMDPAKAKTTTARVTGKEVCELFVEHARVTLKPKTHRWHKQILDAFGLAVASMDGNGVSPKEVTKFLADHPQWNVTTRSGRIASIKRAWAWATEEGHITLNPLSKMKKPRPNRREEIPDDREIARFLEAAKPEFRQLLDFIYTTGCRPGEAAMIERRHVDRNNKQVRFRIGEDKTSRKTGRPRVIQLNENALAILDKLHSAGQTGALFRNSRGNPWTEYAISCAARKCRDRAGLDSRAVVYALRHHWATDALAQGRSPAIVAEMMGNSPEMVVKVYSHVSDLKNVLMQTANEVRPKI